MFVEDCLFLGYCIIRVAPIWEKCSDFKSGLRIFVVLHKDSKNALRIDLTLKPRSRRAPEDLLPSKCLNY